MQFVSLSNFSAVCSIWLFSRLLWVAGDVGRFCLFFVVIFAFCFSLNATPSEFPYPPLSSRCSLRLTTQPCNCNHTALERATFAGLQFSEHFSQPWISDTNASNGWGFHLSFEFFVLQDFLIVFCDLNYYWHCLETPANILLRLKLFVFDCANIAHCGRFCGWTAVAGVTGEWRGQCNNTSS